MKKTIVLFVLVVVILFGSYYKFETRASDLMQAGGDFRSEKIPLQSYDLYDLGTTDVNNDGYLDIYTTNHSALQSLLVNTKGKFEADKFLSAGLAQTVDFPGVEDQLIDIRPESPGLYVFRYQRWLVFQAHNIPKSEPVKLKLTVPWGLETRYKGNIELDSDLSITKSILKFSLKDNERIEVRGVFDIVELPHRIEIENTYPLSNIFVGTNKLSPGGREFVLNWRDRHAMAWSDVNKDGQPDVYISRGGVKGSIAAVGMPIQDELFVQTDTLKFTDLLPSFGLKKSLCPGRQTTWVDTNLDGLLDLHLVCGRSAKPNIFPDQLWLRRKDGTFEEVAKSAGLANSSLSVGVWFDVDGDLDPDYLTNQENQVVLYRNAEGVFSKNIVAEHSNERIRKFTLVDIDGDGDTDSYAVGKVMSVLLLNDGGNFISSSLERWGLPEKAATANWVDYDNDGLLDLHVIPDGLLRRDSPGGKFAEVGSMYYKRQFSRVKEARCSWSDFHNDGGIDAVCNFAYHPSKAIHSFETKILGRDSSKRSGAAVYVNQLFNNGNHWLQVKLVGAPGNAESIGAKVLVHAAGMVQSRLVGHAEGAHFSQGHYRLYFGLGEALHAEKIEVHWPDGKVQVLKGVETDQLLVIDKAQYVE